MRRMLTVVALVVVVSCLAGAVFAQGGAPAAPGAPGAAPGATRGGMPGMMNPGMMNPMMMTPPVISVTEKYVYVIYAGTLFQFDANTLQVVNKASLMSDRMRGERGGQAGGNRHGGGQGAAPGAAPGANATPPGAAGPAPAQ